MVRLPAGFENWRFYQVYGLLEFRINNLSVRKKLSFADILRSLRFLNSRFRVPATVLIRTRLLSGRGIGPSRRTGLNCLDDWRRRLCGFFGHSARAGFANSGITLVV